MELLFRSLVGSQNYNLCTPRSDTDYRGIYLPGLQDIYNKKEISFQKIQNGEDMTGYDLRNLPMFFEKSNIFFLEILFTKDMYVNQDISEASLLADTLVRAREEIARVHLPALYKSSMGSAMKNKRIIHEEGRMNTKKAAFIIQTLDFISRYAENGFNDFGKALRYEEGNPMREDLIALKSGDFRIYDKYYEDVLTKALAVEIDYNKYQKDEAMIKKVSDLVESVFWEYLKKAI